MSDIILTDKQNKIKNDAIDWYMHVSNPDFLEKNLSISSNKDFLVFPIVGIAGSGKTTLISIIYNEIGLTDDEIAYCAYTGMASCVLIRKGISASTIHKLIYVPVEVYDKELKRTKIVFKLKDKLNDEIKLIVVDEGSMVSDAQMDELLFFGIPIIIVGDHFQLKPIYGEMNRFMKNPKGILNEPLRQALDNPIIWIANNLRNGIKPKIGNYGDKVHIYSKRDFNEEILINSDQIIAGKNRTCDYISKLIRIKFKGIKSRYPVDGDKLICIKNDWSKCLSNSDIETYLVNGLIGNVSNIQYNGIDETFRFDFTPSFMQDVSFKNILGDKLVFDDVSCKDDNYIIENYKETANIRIPLYSRGITIDKFMYGDCITVYKMQGSQERSITYIDEVLNYKTYFNHFYTAVTRAEEELNILL